jgi:formylglycine-generating enzyme required for sulfatase activity
LRLINDLLVYSLVFSFLALSFGPMAMADYEGFPSVDSWLVPWESDVTCLTMQGPSNRFSPNIHYVNDDDNYAIDFSGCSKHDSSSGATTSLSSFSKDGHTGEMQLPKLYSPTNGYVEKWCDKYGQRDTCRDPNNSCHVSDDEQACSSGGYGNHLKIKTSSGRFLVMAHFYNLDPGLVSRLKAGNRFIRAGAFLGYMGNSGYVESKNGGTGLHLHFEVDINANTLEVFRTKNKEKNNEKIWGSVTSCEDIVARSKASNQRPASGLSCLNKMGTPFVYMKEGSFTFGATKDVKTLSSLDVVASRIYIDKPFLIGKFEATLWDWLAAVGNIFMPETPIEAFVPMYESDDRKEYSELSEEEQNAYRENHNKFYNSLKFPLVNITFREVGFLISRINANYDYQDLFALPTEKQWEYACKEERSPETIYSKDNIGRLKLLEWTPLNSDGHYHEVGVLTANVWGLHDMLGNVMEWTQLEGTTYLMKSPVKIDNLTIARPLSGQSSKSGSSEVMDRAQMEILKGRSFFVPVTLGTQDYLSTFRCSYRSKGVSSMRLPTIGFRLVMNPY